MHVDPPRPPLVCDVAQEIAGDAVVLWGAISAQTDARGKYVITVRKSGPTGASNIRQAGEFIARPGSAAAVGRVSVRIEPGGSFDVVLTAEADGQEAVCTRRGERVK
ncbi:curli-like amyloid fiber formation chaperone CsgH [Alsobacter sp. KACC 23698]|uniref:curli-like amyloid fiber formation chaperone CsgH n=1 Tax=Alsobacter sp. KACC 23698 TaxID=3149229 RepID=UPI003877F654